MMQTLTERIEELERAVRGCAKCGHSPMQSHWYHCKVCGESYGDDAYAALIRSTDLAALLDKIRALPGGLEKDYVELLDVLRCSHERIRELESELGRLTQPDGSEVMLGVTAERVEELRAMAKEAEQMVNVQALRDALRFYDLVRLAWRGSIEEYNEDMGARDMHIAELKAELRQYEPSDGVMHQRLAYIEAIRAAADLYLRIRDSETEHHAPWDDFDAWLALPVVHAARKDPTI